MRRVRGGEHSPSQTARGVWTHPTDEAYEQLVIWFSLSKVRTRDDHFYLFALFKALYIELVRTSKCALYFEIFIKKLKNVKKNELKY